MKTIVNIIFGSHLYGTDTPESDRDYKGIFLPSKYDIFLGKIPKSITKSTKLEKKEGQKNTPDDVDSEMYSLHYFIQLSIEGQTVALDMLHAPSNMILESSYIWEKIVENRKKFYTKNLKAFIGYARRQAAKYGIKGSRLSESKKFLDFLKTIDKTSILRDSWDKIPLGEYIILSGLNINNIKQVQVCGKLFQETAKIGYIIPIMEQFVDNYEERAKKAEKNENIDWKALQHAVRAAMEIKELLINNTITFPLKEVDILRNIKQGKLDYNTEVCPLLESLMDEVEILSKKSLLPEKVDISFWEHFIYDIIDKEVKTE